MYLCNAEIVRDIVAQWRRRAAHLFRNSSELVSGLSLSACGGSFRRGQESRKVIMEYKPGVAIIPGYLLSPV